MSDFSMPSAEAHFAAPTISIPGQKITWAGEGIKPDRFLFGTDNGLVLECGIHGSLENMNAVRVGRDDESINGISFYYDGHALHMAATTRSDIILNSFFVNPIKRQGWHAGFGAHGINQTLGGHFVAPAGPSGVVVLMPTAGAAIDVQNTAPARELQYFYDYAVLGPDSDSGAEISVFACRTDGLAFFQSEPGFGLRFKKKSELRSQRVDFISVTSIRSTALPLAMIGLGKDRSLHFMRDPFRSPIIDSLALPFVPGTAYKVLRHGPHAILFTSKGICIVLDVVSQFHRGKYIGGHRAVRFLQMEAIDINIAFDKWLLVVTSDGVVRMDLAELLPGVDIPESIRRRMNIDFEGLWKPENESVELQESVMREANLEADMAAASR
jgi:hypothetical protein